MRQPLPKRRSDHGILSRLLALILFARLVVPAAAMSAQESSPDLDLDAALQTICHSGSPHAPDDPAPAPIHHDCLLCPACHLLWDAAAPVVDSPALPAAASRPLGLASPLPPAIGPPRRPRRVAQPTGPPTLLV